MDRLHKDTTQYLKKMSVFKMTKWSLRNLEALEEAEEAPEVAIDLECPQSLLVGGAEYPSQ
jgi:hypothetical protein